mmetsp:Transcript_111638/g.288549  ORF Transcript_111638/g.288549 Transcript_111638/m.288549 type:complete len:228 (-) Transcript_111638:225-908(-)
MKVVRVVARRDCLPPISQQRRGLKTMPIYFEHGCRELHSFLLQGQPWPQSIIRDDVLDVLLALIRGHRSLSTDLALVLRAQFSDGQVVLCTEDCDQLHRHEVTPLRELQAGQARAIKLLPPLRLEVLSYTHVALLWLVPECLTPSRLRPRTQDDEAALIPEVVALDPQLPQAHLAVKRLHQLVREFLRPAFPCSPQTVLEPPEPFLPLAALAPAPILGEKMCQEVNR